MGQRLSEDPYLYSRWRPLEKPVRRQRSLPNAHIETLDISRNNVLKRANQWFNNRLKILVSTFVRTFSNLVGSKEFISSDSQSSLRLTQARPFSRMRPLKDLGALTQYWDHSRSPFPLASTPGTLFSLEDPQKDSLVAGRLSSPGDLMETTS